MRTIVLSLAVVLALLSAATAQAQSTALNFLTIERPPFAFEQNGQAAGFSIDLMRQIAEGLGREVRFTFVSEFSAMLGAVEQGQVDGAVANISITSEREAIMDFSRPIFESGLKVMISGRATEASVWQVLFRWEILLLVLAAFGAIFLIGMLMWVFERGKHPYFDHEARKAMFPSFWWALTFVVNGGFEQNVPRSVLGRMLGVVMVVASLFIVSIFVANITAALTVEAITGSIQSLDDLDGRRVGTTAGSTSSAFLDARNVSHRQFADYRALIEGFEAGELEAVVFDGPILAHYLARSSDIDAQLLERMFRPEDYGIALPQGSDLREPINRVLLRLTESGRYAELMQKWFGSQD